MESGLVAGRRGTVPAAALVAALLIAGCATVQTFSTPRHYAISLLPGQLAAGGIAFITPSTATGREEEKQALAFVFADVMKRDRPDTRVVALPEALGTINRAGLSAAYKRMYDDYRDTGLFKSDTLREVGRLTGVRYIVQIKLQEFSEGAKQRFGAFGLRILETRYARVRVFMQIWDSRDGTVAWEGLEEITYSHERIGEEAVTFQKAVQQTAESLVKHLP